VACGMRFLGGGCFMIGLRCSRRGRSVTLSGLRIGGVRLSGVSVSGGSVMAWRNALVTPLVTR